MFMFLHFCEFKSVDYTYILLIHAGDMGMDCLYTEINHVTESGTFLLVCLFVRCYFDDQEQSSR